MYETVDERTALAESGVRPVDTKCIDTDKALTWEPMQVSPRIVAREFVCRAGPDLYAGIFLLEALKAILSIAATMYKRSE